MASACWLIPSMSPCWVDCWRGTLEYCSSTGRVRNTQPDVDNTARNKIRVQKSELRLINIRWPLEHLSIPRPKRFKTRCVPFLERPDNYRETYPIGSGRGSRGESAIYSSPAHDRPIHPIPSSSRLCLCRIVNTVLGNPVRKIIWLLVIATLGTAGWLAWAVLTPSEPSGQVFVMLHPGYSTRRIAAELKAAGIVRSEDAFVLWHYVHPGRSLKAGEYLFDKPANMLDVQKRLQRGDVYFHTVIVPEGFTMFDIARAVEAAGLGPAGNFLKVAQSDASLVADFAPQAHSLEGYLFPDTYQFSRMMTMHEMAAAMVKQFRQVARQISLI